MGRESKRVDQRVVVVTGSDRGSKKAWFVLHFFLSWHKIKAVTISPKNQEFPSRFHGLILTGGTDLCPESYGVQKKHSCEPARDVIEMELLQMALEKDIPIFGICRGMQLINAAFGGTLHHDIHSLDLATSHPYTPLPLRTISIVPRTNLHLILHTTKIKANALHHQAIDKIGKGLRKNAFDQNGIIQGIEHPQKAILGVQWHPEYLLYMPLHRKLLHGFLQKVKSL